MYKRIKKVAVLGSGVMGSRIACHFANIGIEALLLDICPRELNEKEKNAGLSLDHPSVKNRLVTEAFQQCIKSNPSPLYLKSYASRVELGNFDDDFDKVAECDWILEAVVERLDIKQQVYERLEKVRKPGSIVSSNTSGIPIHMLAEGRSEDFQENFLGTHFFNPPRYLPLLELIPAPKTKPALLSFMQDFGTRFLGKTSIVCKDTPAFIANRVGVMAMMNAFHLTKELGLSVKTVDTLTGPIVGRPKSATFRTSDVVGLDTLIHVAKGLQKAVPDDEAIKTFDLPDYLEKMLEQNKLGSKTGEGFYKKVKTEKGKEIKMLDLNSLEYVSADKKQFSSIAQAKEVDDFSKKLKILLSAKDESGQFYRAHFFAIFSYVANRIPEISDTLVAIDQAVKAGFGWENGPFETWDAIGFEKSLTAMKEMQLSIPNWIQQMNDEGKTFYKVENGVRQFYDVASSTYKAIPGRDQFIYLDDYRADKVVWENKEACILDLGDGILNLEFRSKMNTLGGDVLAAIHKAIDLAEESYQGLVIANEGKNFSVGANIGLIFMMAAEQDYDELNFAIKHFQDTMMRIRYSHIPVVLAVHQMCLGGGTEAALHADAVIASAETYMGLVEFGVGVIPGGGGTKELTARATEHLVDGDIELPHLKKQYLNIGMAKVSTSAMEAFGLGLLQYHKDELASNADRRILAAKKKCLSLAEKGYTMPLKKQVRVLGKQSLGMFEVGAESMLSANYISEHDRKISQKLAWVMSGGDLSEPSTVTEQYLLDLEREAFLSLCGERKTLERLQHMLKTGKPLRN